MTCVLAIDIGGTKLAAALVDEAGSILRSATRPTPREEVMSALKALVTEVMDGGPPPQAVGIGCAGPVDLAAGTVSPVNMPSWRGFPLREEVRKLTTLPTVLAGDAQCFALGEHWLGAGRGCTSLLGIVVSTGIGGGLVLDGVPLLGPTGNAGHVGHMSIDPYGERCECGGRGCVERYSSGPNMARWALENGWSPGASSGAVGSAVQGQDGDVRGEEGKAPADARMLAQDARAGDPIAVAAFQRGARALAGMIASTAAAVELTAVVIGGGVSAAGEVLFEPLRHALDDVTGLPFVRAVEVRQSSLGVRASLAGAAQLAWRPHPSITAP
ncbi:ROK family protein [Nonomuraea gerenzanensis]|uniref:Sugar kinase n=1 Tax=Nonomuraea gerenzanensis TaxID=93944 RepID=A0A1M4E047_9ACTN|nr:ROK family protein [Nonomuraea gerenzanensis]UBU14470.1 ROK family protein [Nonomuraea gerenzanensis]SBO92186.1 Sugar kinase [Nonomuraea gerenzanensis]